jgi:hypothetical protein
LSRSILSQPQGAPPPFLRANAAHPERVAIFFTAPSAQPKASAWVRDEVLRLHLKTPQGIFIEIYSQTRYTRNLDVSILDGEWFRQQVALAQEANRV